MIQETPPKTSRASRSAPRSPLTGRPWSGSTPTTSSTATPIPGSSSRAAVIDHLRGQVDAFAGFGYTIRHAYSDNADGAVVEWNMSGDYAGKPVSLDIITAYDFLGDRIVSERNYWDNAALLAQLG